MTQEGKDLPLMDEFSEESLLDQIKVEEEETEEEIEARELKEKEEADALEAKEKEEEEEAEEKEKLRLAKEQEDELTDEEKEALKAKKETEDEGSFWEDVDAITGNTYEVDYGEVEPDSPEGAALREKVVADTAIAENLDFIKENYPKAYEVLEHVSNGGKFEDLVNPKTTDYSSIVLTEANLNQQKAVLKDYYLSKGLSEAKALRMVEDDEDSEEGLFKSAEAALKEKQEEETGRKEDILAGQAKTKEAQDLQDKQFGETLSSIINKGVVGNFKIPKGEAEEFYKHVISQVQRSGNGYALTVPLTNENFNEKLGQMFFGYKKGDLSKYVATATATKGAKTLKRNMKKETSGAESSSEEKTRRQNKKLPAMGEFEVG